MSGVGVAVKKDLLAVAGNALVLPVASGFKVSRSYPIERTEVGGAVKSGH